MKTTQQNIQVLELERPMVDIETKLGSLREDPKASKTAAGKKKITELEKKHEPTRIRTARAGWSFGQSQVK